MVIPCSFSTSNIGGVLNFRPGLGTTASDIFNLSICAYDHSGDGNADGLSINGADGVSFSTGGNTRSERMRINSSGQLMLKQTTTILSAPFQMTFDGENEQGITIKNSANSTNGGAIRFVDYTNAASGGGIYYSSSNSISYTTSSDYRLKENIVPMTGALAKIQQLKPVTFNWKQDNSASQGFLAHELQAVIPEAVIGAKDGIDANGNPRYQGVDTSYVVATLTAAMQEQQALITALTARITALETPAVTPPTETP